MSDKKTLVVIESGYEDKCLEFGFLYSLLEDNEKLFYSFGCIGTLEDSLDCRIEKENGKHFVILDLDYVDNFPKEDFFDIVRIGQITPKVVYTRGDNEKRFSVEYPMRDIEDGFVFYNDLMMGDRYLRMVRDLDNSDDFRKDFLKKDWFGFGKNDKIIPTCVSVGLECGEYLIHAEKGGALYNGSYW